jgi:hypothetical protein
LSTSPSGAVPTILVGSTYYDLRRIRTDLTTFLEKGLGYRALISEESTFPIDPDADAIKNCRRRVEKDADILLLVVASRYGSMDSDTAKSIMNLEYLSA